MSRTFVALAALLASGTALADTSELTYGVASLPILSATPYVNVTVRNLSASTDPEDRVLTVVSAPPVVDVEAQAFCVPVAVQAGGWTRLDRAQLMLGGPIIAQFPDGYEVVDWTVWDRSPMVDGFGNVTASDLAFEHAIDLPQTWDDPLIDFGFNPVGLVEEHLETWVDNGGSAADFLREDAVFEAHVDLNVVAWCVNTTQFGERTYPGITTRPLTIAVFYQGDPDIREPSRWGTPTDVLAPKPPRAR